MGWSTLPYQPSLPGFEDGDFAASAQRQAVIGYTSLREISSSIAASVDPDSLGLSALEEDR